MRIVTVFIVAVLLVLLGVRLFDTDNGGIDITDDVLTGSNTTGDQQDNTDSHTGTDQDDMHNMFDLSVGNQYDFQVNNTAWYADFADVYTVCTSPCADVMVFSGSFNDFLVARYTRMMTNNGELQVPQSEIDDFAADLESREFLTEDNFFFSNNMADWYRIMVAVDNVLYVAVLPDRVLAISSEDASGMRHVMNETELKVMIDTMRW